MTWLEYNEALQELRADSEVVVGTGAQATWRLRRADLMPRHFVVASTADATTIRPFSRDAVVTLNGRQLPLAESELHDGDVISAGSGDFRFWTEAPTVAPGESRALVRPPLVAHLIDPRRRSANALHRTSTGIGRDQTNSLVIDDAMASNFHAEVRREAGGHVLRASDEAMVRVNGRPVSGPVLLNEGDEVEIANLQVRYTREPLPAGISAEPRSDTLLSAPEADLQLVLPRGERPEAVGSLSSAVMTRTPMRAVAFVSSVIAAVAIATLVFLHRGP